MRPAELSEPRCTSTLTRTARSSRRPQSRILPVGLRRLTKRFPTVFSSMLTKSADASFLLSDYQFQLLVEPGECRMILFAKGDELIIGELNEFFQDLFHYFGKFLA